MNLHSECEMKFFIENIIGWSGSGGESQRKANLGTNLHKVMEILALIKQGRQQEQEFIIEDEIGCKFSTITVDLDKITKKVFKYYSKVMTEHSWSNADFTLIQNSVKIATSYNEGMFNPLNRKIIQPELHFDIEIKKPWAAYRYETPEGVLEGNLALKGTIDLITEENPTIYEVTDYKNGAHSKDWVTGKEKNSETLREDKQFRVYHYALSHLYPHVETWAMTIFFVNAGGPHTVLFTKDDLPKTELMIKEKFERVKSCQNPKLTKTFRCTKTCQQSRRVLKAGIIDSTFEDTHVKPIREFRNGQLTPKGEYMSKCEQLKLEFGRKSMDKIMQEYKKPGFDPAAYKSPGSV